MNNKPPEAVSHAQVRLAREILIEALRKEGALDEDTIDELEFQLEYATEPQMRKEFEEGDAQPLEDCVKLEDLEWWNTNIKSL